MPNTYLYETIRRTVRDAQNNEAILDRIRTIEKVIEQLDKRITEIDERLKSIESKPKKHKKAKKAKKIKMKTDDYGRFSSIFEL
jgi:chromosome segregation ATPase